MPKPVVTKAYLESVYLEAVCAIVSVPTAEGEMGTKDLNVLQLCMASEANAWPLSHVV